MLHTQASEQSVAVSFCWVSVAGYCGIIGNIKADEAAKNATFQLPITQHVTWHLTFHQKLKSYSIAGGSKNGHL